LSRTLKPTSEAQEAAAAVAILLKTTDQGLKILLVKRTEKLSGPWSGQMAFPGGKRDPKDRDIRQTVVRETLEEISINLAHDCRFSGILKNMRSTVRPNLLVAPFVILLEHKPTIMLNEELERYTWIFLNKLQECEGTVKFPFGEVPAYLVEGNAVWGLTYRILKNLGHIIRVIIQTLEQPFNQSNNHKPTTLNVVKNEQNLIMNGSKVY